MSNKETRSSSRTRTTKKEMILLINSNLQEDTLQLYTCVLNHTQFVHGFIVLRMIEQV